MAAAAGVTVVMTSTIGGLVRDIAAHEAAALLRSRNSFHRRPPSARGFGWTFPTPDLTSHEGDRRHAPPRATS